MRQFVPDERVPILRLQLLVYQALSVPILRLSLKLLVYRVPILRLSLKLLVYQALS